MHNNVQHAHQYTAAASKVSMLVLFLLPQCWLEIEDFLGENSENIWPQRPLKATSITEPPSFHGHRFTTGLDKLK